MKFRGRGFTFFTKAFKRDNQTLKLPINLQAQYRLVFQVRGLLKISPNPSFILNDFLAFLQFFQSFNANISGICFWS